MFFHFFAEFPPKIKKMSADFFDPGRKIKTLEMPRGRHGLIQNPCPLLAQCSPKRARETGSDVRSTKAGTDAGECRVPAWAVGALREHWGASAGLLRKSTQLQHRDRAVLPPISAHVGCGDFVVSDKHVSCARDPGHIFASLSNINC